jgi:hypothetical protein
MLKKIPNGLSEIIATFGNPKSPDFEAKNIVLFPLPYPLYYGTQKVTRSRAHRLAVPHFIKALENVYDRGLAGEVKHYGGIFAQRPKRGQSSHMSTHCWGIAGDFEPAKYPLGSPARFSDAVVKCFADAGFFYGGDFKGRPDGMHFQLCAGY